MKMWISKLKTRLPVMGLLLVTILFWLFYDRYEPVGPELLPQPALSEAYRVYGDVTEEQAGRFVMEVPNGGKRAGLYFRIPEAVNNCMIRVRTTVTFNDVKVGKNLWDCTRVCFVQRDKKNKWISTKHVLMGGWGSARRTHFEDQFEIVSEAVTVDLCLQQHGTVGSAVFEGVSAQPVRVRSSFVWWRIIFVVLWVALAIYYFPICRLHRRRLKFLILLNAVVIIVGAVMPADWITDASKKAEQVWVDYHKKPAVKIASPVKAKGIASTKKVRVVSTPVRVPKVEDDFVPLISERVHSIGHFSLFASLCLLVYLSAALEQRHSNYFIKVGFDIFLFAVTTEALQFLTLDRAAHVDTLLLDLYGMVLAFVVFLCVLPLVKRVQSRGTTGS